MTDQEIHDFYVERIGSKKFHNERLHTINADFDDEEELNRNPLLYWKKGPNDSMVRIPRICFLEDSSRSKIADFFGVKYKVLIGGHTFIQEDGQMDCVQTFLDSIGIYSVTDPSPISCVYPCYQNNKRQKAGNMILGLKFERTRIQSVGGRTFGRQMDSQLGNGGVFDLLDSYLSPDSLVSYASETFNPNLSEPTVLFAIYLCRGARLVVKDDRYYCRPNSKTHTKNKNFCHSLLQMGSLVVAEGVLNLEMAFDVIVPNGDKEARTVRYKVEWMRAGEEPNNLLESERFNRDLDYSEKIDSTFQLENLKTLNKQKRFVIFLGPNESERNSSTWELKITTKQLPNESTAQVVCSLLAPQNGHIEDIQPWEAGFQQVIWRHRYERLFESVLSPVRTPGFEFDVPPEEILARILGDQAKPCNVKVPPICKVPEEMADDLYITIYPKALESLNIDERDWPQMSSPLSPPPLHPPIWDESSEKLYYLQYGSQPKYNPNRRVFEINNQNFKLFIKTIDNFIWDCSHAIRPNSNNWQRFDQTCYRLANDYRIYQKTGQQLGTVDVCYFKKV